jgi:predicted ABC-type ATPase
VKELVILGGPNGAGKTTMAAGLLPSFLGVTDFVNADEIARGLSPFDVGLIYDNSDAGGSLIAQRRQDGSFVVHNKALWSRVEEATG